MKTKTMRAGSVGVGVLLWAVVALSIGLHATNAFALKKGPIYDPESKSYFELRDDNINAGGSAVWQDARALAVSKSYKGIPGRLAIVRDSKTHDFLRRNFALTTETWIGLRYWCRYRKLQWVNGKFLKPGEFGAWARQWYKDSRTVCGKGAFTGERTYMPVFYRPAQRGMGFVWQASGAGKGYKHYFVEYPAQKAQE